MKNVILIRTVIVAAILGFVSISNLSIASTFTPVNLNSIVNHRIQNKNAFYPEGEFLTRFAVPFYISSGGNNAWGAGEGIEGGRGHDGTWKVSVDVGVNNVKTIYTLANTNWGNNGGNRFSVTANFDNGESLTWVYTDGQQLRDWNLFPAFATGINGTDTNEVFRVSPPLQVHDPATPDVLDMQTLFVPERYQSLTLETLDFIDQRQVFVHSVFLSGVTLSNFEPVTPSLNPVTSSLKPVPLPASFPLFFVAIGFFGFIDRRKF